MLVAATGALFLAQAHSVRRVGAERRAAVRQRRAAVSFILPHTAREHRWFKATAVTAGVWEELLYRGFAVWTLTPWLTLWGQPRRM